MNPATPFAKRNLSYLPATLLATLWATLFLSTWIAAASDPEEEFRKLREAMVRDQIAARGVKDDRVLQVMRELPRHLFVPPRWQEQAYTDKPIPIGEGQTISQPYIVALMTELLRPQPGDVVLEVGTGSGYQAAVQIGRAHV